jgi:peptide/nickel transport system permease protein
MGMPTTDITALTAYGPRPAVAVTSAKRRRLRFIANRKTATGLVIVGFFALFSLIGPWIAPFDPSERSKDLLEAPSAKHWFGTTHLGQDIFSQVLVGTRGVIVVGFLAGAVATVLAIIIGITAGFLGGAADEGLSALSNVFLVIPVLPLVIIITSSIPEAGDLMVALVIGLTSWALGGADPAGADALATTA